MKKNQFINLYEIDNDPDKPKKLSFDELKRRLLPGVYYKFDSKIYSYVAICMMIDEESYKDNPELTPLEFAKRLSCLIKTAYINILNLKIVKKRKKINF